MTPSILRDAIIEYFSKDEFVALCFDLDIDYDDLIGRTSKNKAMSLINICIRENRILDLIEICRKERPRVNWEWSGIPMGQHKYGKNLDEIVQSALGQAVRGEFEDALQLIDYVEEIDPYYWRIRTYRKRIESAQQNARSLAKFILLGMKWANNFVIRKSFVRLPIALISVTIIVFVLYSLVQTIFTPIDNDSSTPPDLESMEFDGLPCNTFAFLPESMELTLESRRVLDNCVIPILSENPELFVRVRGSSAWPVNDPLFTEQDILATAKERAQSVVNYLVSQGIDPARLKIETVLPPAQNRNTDNPNVQAQDRYVELELITGGQ